MIQVRLRTLTLIRWVAIAGQALALLVVHFGFGFDVPLGPAFAVVAASLLLNLIVLTGHPTPVRLGVRSAAAFLAFDILQLAALLYLTGGLENPFSFLLLAPVAVSATILTIRSTISLCDLSIACITILAIWHFPLPWTAGVFCTSGLRSRNLDRAGDRYPVFRNLHLAGGRRSSPDTRACRQPARACPGTTAGRPRRPAAAAHELGSPLGRLP